MTELNLIRDPWIPVRLRSGRIVDRSPWHVFGDADNPAAAVASPRADLDGGIVQLLIGLLQTAMAPADEDAWCDLAERQPTPAELRERLEPLAGAFELLGPGPRFQQDARLASAGGEPWPIEKLLIDLGLDRGPDHFARSGSVGALCLPCAAAALATLQASAPAGGRGHLTSLRGGGPLTTLVVPAGTEATLWTAVWLNVLPLSSFPASAPDFASAALFPWLATAEAEEPARPPELTPEDAHRFHAFFGMPRRIWLGQADDGDCGLCGRRAPCLLGYAARPNGIRYTGAWIHPLSPYRRFKEAQWLAVKGDETGLGYRHWLGLVVAPPDGEVRPALPVGELLRSRDRFDVAKELRLWAFGYAMDNIKAEAWSEGSMPIYAVPAEIALAYAEAIRQLVEGAKLAESSVRYAFKKLVARRPKDVKREPAQISARFWERTESAFYRSASALLQTLREGLPDLPHRERWHQVLAREAMALFDLEVAEADFRAADPAQVARAWNDLQRSLYGKKLKQLLGLPIEDPKRKGGRR
jgi:CRISPR system Cascade subunit CasA